MSEAVEKPAHRPISDQDIELLLASANAIQRLIDERNLLRSRVDTLERELARLGHQTRLIVNNYRRLTTEYISQFQLVDSEASNLFPETAESAESPVDLAQMRKILKQPLTPSGPKTLTASAETETGRPVSAPRYGCLV